MSVRPTAKEEPLSVCTRRFLPSSLKRILARRAWKSKVFDTETEISVKKRNMPKISAVILAVLICVFAGILIGKLKENYDPEIFSENYISVELDDRACVESTSLDSGVLYNIVTHLWSVAICTRCY